MRSRFQAGSSGWAALSIVALSAGSCSLAVGLDDLTFDGTSSSASSSASSASSGSDVSSGSGAGGAGGSCTIAGTNANLHFTPEMNTAMGDLTGVTVRVFSPNGSGSWGPAQDATISGSSFSVANVPCGEYLLELDDDTLPAYFVISDGNLGPDVGRAILGRPDVTHAGTGTNIDMSVSGLAPWSSLDGVQLFSIGAGTAGLNLDGPLVLTSGATASTGTVSVNASLTPPNLISGDDVTVTQLTPTNLTVGHYLKVEQAWTTPSATLVDGGETTMTPMLIAVAQDQSQDVRLHLTDFETAWVGGGASIENESFLILPVPGPAGATNGLYAQSTPRLVAYTPIQGQDVYETFTWGDPFTAMHDVVGRLEIDVSANWLLPGATTAANEGLTVTYTALWSSFGTAVLPPFGPPTSITIDSQPFASAATISNQPALAWSPPPDASPDRYMIAVDSLSLTGTTTIATPYASYFTTKTSFTLPPLPSGSYGFAVLAQESPGIDFDAHPRARTTPFYQTGALSGVLTVE